MSVQRGAFIAIESPLESYGATQAGLLKNKLEVAGYEVVYFSFPHAGEPSSYFAEQFEAGNYELADDTTPYASSLFHALDHVDASKAIRTAIDEGKIVIAHKYLGANMVEQGALLRHPGERRGYFLWLDNLEARVLGAVRPDKTFILTLADQHVTNLLSEMPELKQDQKVPCEEQSRLYTELCDIYPKDFIRIDGERNGKELSVETTTNLVFGLIEPLLPVQEKEEALEEPTKQTDDLELVLISDTVLPIFEATFQISRLLQDQLLAVPGLRIYKHPVEKLKVITPSYFDKKLQKNYRTACRAILKAYKELAKATDEISAQSVLPLAILDRVTVQVNTTSLQELIVMLLSNSLPESWELGQQLLKASREHGTEISAVDVAYRASTRRALAKLSDELVPQVHATPKPDQTVFLISTIPRNELDLATKIIYEHTNLNLEDIDKQANSWSYEQKQAVLEAVTSKQRVSPQIGGALGDSQYTWDIIVSYSNLQAIRIVEQGVKMHLQQLTPRYGYDMPDAIDAAGASELLETCFDASTALYSALQSADFELETGYATLMGHKQRASLTFTADQYAGISSSSLLTKQPFIKSMLDDITEKHSLIGNAILPLAKTKE